MPSYAEHFRALMLQGNVLSTPNQAEDPGKLKIASHRIPNILDTFGYLLEHQTKWSSFVNFT